MKNKVELISSQQRRAGGFPVTPEEMPNYDWFTPDTVDDPEDLPEPVGYRVLVRPCPRRQKIGSLFVPQKTMEDQAFQNSIGRLLAVGPLAWDDKGDGEPWASVGD